MTDIAQKLKDACVVDPNYGKSVTLTLDYDDYMEAADLITTLRAEVERLKEWNREIALNAREFAAENEAILAANRDVMLHWEVLKADYEKLRAELREMDAHMEENITLTEALRHEQEWVLRLSKALRGIIRVADRNTVEFNEARAALEERK